MVVATVTLIYFAKIRELIGTSEEEYPLPEAGATVQALLESLMARGEPYLGAFESGRVLAAINQEMVSLSSGVADGDELALFPPVTGG
ncbi:Molybdopterin converting factor, small subunit [gamma proteobacterium HdN1]|nr:Molybdopterin converting factor, small subunit [gamma proteobacterium HdN1]